MRDCVCPLGLIVCECECEYKSQVVYYTVSIFCRSEA